MSSNLRRSLVALGIVGCSLAIAPQAIAALTLSATTISSDANLILSPTSNLGIGNVNPQALLHLGTAGSRAGIIKVDGSTSGTITIQPAASAGTWTLTLPTSAGTNGQVLTTNGSGITSWTTVAGGGITNGAGANVIPKSDGVNLVASRITDDGTTVNLIDVAHVTLNTGGLFSVNAGSDAEITSFGGAGNIQIGAIGVDNNTQFILSDSAQTISLNAANGVFINGVKKYVALLSQTGTSAPVATVLENTLGGTVVWSRTGVGNYVGTLTGAFPDDKTFTIKGSNEADAADAPGNIMVVRGSNDTILIQTGNSGDFADDGMYDLFIEIRVYP